MIKSIKRFDEFLDSVINYIDRYSILYIIVLVIINLVIKLLYAGDMPYWLDETSSISIAQSTFSEIIEKSLGDPNTPLYFILLKGWMAVFGISEFSTRLLSVIFSASTIIPLYYLGRRFFNLETAILVTLIFAVSHIHVFFSHETRGYTLISLMVTLSFYFYFQIVHSPSIRNLVKYTLAISLLLYIHPVPILIIMIQFFSLIVYFKQNRKGSIYVLIGQIITGLLFSIWFFNNTWFGSMYGWIPAPDLKQVKRLLITYSNTSVVYHLYLILFVACILLIVFYLYKRKPLFINLKPLMVSFLWACFPILVIFIISQYSSRFIPRYMLFASPGIYLLFAYIISSIPVNKSLKLLLLLIILGSSVRYIDLNPVKGEDWPGAVSFIKQHKDDSTLTVISADYQYMSFTYYYDTELFKLGKKAPELLKQENIYFTKTADVFERVDETRYNKIHLCLSHDAASDPDGTLFTYLAGKYPITDEFIAESDVRVFIFDRRLPLSVDSIFMNFEKDTLFNVKGSVSPIAFSGNCVTKVNKDQQYSEGLGCRISELEGFEVRLLKISVWSNSTDVSADANLVFSLENDEGIYFWKAAKLEISQIPETWNETKWTINIPHTPEQDDELKVYVWYTGNAEILIDDLLIKFY